MIVLNQQIKIVSKKIFLGPLSSYLEELSANWQQGREVETPCCVHSSVQWRQQQTDLLSLSLCHVSLSLSCCNPVSCQTSDNILLYTECIVTVG